MYMYEWGKKKTPSSLFSREKQNTQTLSHYELDWIAT